MTVTVAMAFSLFQVMWAYLWATTPGRKLFSLL